VRSNAGNAGNAAGIHAPQRNRPLSFTDMSAAASSSHISFIISHARQQQPIASLCCSAPNSSSGARRWREPLVVTARVQPLPQQLPPTPAPAIAALQSCQLLVPQKTNCFTRIIASHSSCGDYAINRWLYLLWLNVRGNKRHCARERARMHFNNILIPYSHENI